MRAAVFTALFSVLVVSAGAQEPPPGDQPRVRGLPPDKPEFPLIDESTESDWPNFRGPGHDGIARETGFRVDWDEPIPMVWDRAVGSAFSSFACVGDCVYTCGTRAGAQVLYCLNAANGEVVWQVPIEDAFREPQGGDGTRATPTVHGGRVYILGARGTLLCAAAKSGETLWKRSFRHMPQWGYSGSVLIEGDLAIATAGESQGSLAAFDKRTGEKRWQAGDDPAGYATPYPFTFNGKRYVVGFTGKSALVVEADSGRQVLRQPWQTSWEVNAAAPIFHDDHLFLTSGYQTGCGLFRLTPSGDGLAARELWRSKVLRNKFQSCVLHEGHLYSCDQRDMACVEFLTGQEQWRERRVAHGSLVLADGHLIVLTADGELRIAKATPDGFEPSTSARLLTGRCWTVPVLHEKRLYVRNLERAACFDLSK